MTEVSIGTGELGELVKRLDKSSEAFQMARRKAFETAAPKLKQAVDQAVGGEGKVQSWQEKYVGSWGGYAAVRPKAKTYTAVNGRGRKYAVGYVTNAIEGGHKFPRPTGRVKRYKARIASGRQEVPGLHFYAQAEQQVELIAQEAAQSILDALTAQVEGRG